jgi:light-regulated signal transduction histidine kinase (bacteriophytochrome)
LKSRVKERTLKLEEQNKALSAAQESLIMLLEDVNDARKQLTEANEKLVSANKELEAFSYSVSHDLRSPLRAIVGFSDILIEDYSSDLSDEGKRYIERITENTQKMQKLIDDLLEYSRVGRSAIRLQNISTVSLLSKIFEDIKAGEGERKFDFSVDGLIPDIMADRTLVTQMFQNLIGNAVKFTGKKEVAVIKINYENEGRFHIISIKDNGAGFDEKYKSKLFEVFQRLHSTEDFPGTGVGLSIVSKVAAKHGWSLDAESKNGDGAVFYIKIPVEQKKEPQIEERI